MSDFSIEEPENMPLELDFMNGSIITIPIDKPLIFTTNAGAEDPVPDYWDSGVPVMSERFVKLIEESGVTNIQKFPAIVKSKVDESVWDNYVAINILGVIKCADFSRSQYTEIFPGHYRFSKLAIDSEAPKGELMFRLYENPGTIIIGKKVGKHIMLNDPDEIITGWDVKEIIQ
jgi:hypothetical protein